MISTVLAGALTWCCSHAVLVACVTCPKGVWNFFVYGCPVLIKGLFGHPQLDVGTNPLRVFNVVSCSSCSLFFLLYVVVFMLVFWVNETIFWFSTSTST